MKKLLALFLLAALLLCMTACSRDEERDLSALEEYTSGELRALMGAPWRWPTAALSI